MNKELLQQVLDALTIAEAGLADIGDADREPGDDLAWCEARAAQALAAPRQAIATLRAAIAQPEQPAQAEPIVCSNKFGCTCPNHFRLVAQAEGDAKDAANEQIKKLCILAWPSGNPNWLSTCEQSLSLYKREFAAIAAIQKGAV